MGQLPDQGSRSSAKVPSKTTVRALGMKLGSTTYDDDI